WDNSDIIAETLALRHELAQLLGYDNYAARSLASKMAENPDQVLGFLRELSGKSKPFAEKDMAELREFATALGCPDLQAWDLTYFSEKLRVEKYAVSQEELRCYFPAERVIEGMFDVVKRLYDIDVVAVTDFDSWHPDVRFFHIHHQGKKNRQLLS